MLEISGLGKKGIIKNETLSLIVAVIVLVLFVIVVVKVYGAYIAKQELKQANNILELVAGKVESGEQGWRGFSLQGIKSDNGWSLIAWNADEKGKPERCLFSSCVCVCNFGHKEFSNTFIGSELLFGDFDYPDKERVSKTAGSICQNPSTGTCKKLDSNGKIYVGSLASENKPSAFERFATITGRKILYPLMYEIFGSQGDKAAELDPEALREIPYIALPAKLSFLRIIKNENGVIVYSKVNLDEQREGK